MSLAADCNRAIEVDPDYAKGWSRLGNSHQDQKNYEEAAAAYRRALELNPGMRTRWSLDGGGGVWIDTPIATGASLLATELVLNAARRGLALFNMSISCVHALHTHSPPLSV